MDPIKENVLIPGGEFLMGAGDGGRTEQPVHSIWLDAFYLDRTEVPNAVYETFDPAYRRSRQSACDRCPATRLSWFDADAFCRSRGKRLPTEAEWEKAARGPRGWDYSFAATADLSKGRFGRSLTAGPVTVDALEPNGYGLHNMSGNVWEWVNGWFDETYYQNSPPRNPKGPGEGFRKIVRGGSWYNAAYYVHTGMRFGLEPHVKLASLGFRCARDS